MPIETIYRTDDGTEFSTYEEAENHGGVGEFKEWWKDNDLQYSVNEENYIDVFEHCRDYFYNYFHKNV